VIVAVVCYRDDSDNDTSEVRRKSSFCLTSHQGFLHTGRYGKEECNSDDA